MLIGRVADFKSKAMALSSKRQIPECLAVRQIFARMRAAWFNNGQHDPPDVNLNRLPAARLSE